LTAKCAIFVTAARGQKPARSPLVPRGIAEAANQLTELGNYPYLVPGANPTLDQKVARELLVAWLNLVSGREAATQTIDRMKSELSLGLSRACLAKLRRPEAGPQEERRAALAGRDLE
jgi:hypothetical protein